MLSNIIRTLASNAGLRWLSRAAIVGVMALIGALTASVGDLGLTSPEGALIGAVLSFVTQAVERVLPAKVEVSAKP